MTEEASPYEVSRSGMSPVVAPVVAPGLPPAPPTQVPKVFGIIHIIYACLGILYALFGVGAMLFMKVMMEKVEGEVKEVQMFLDVYNEFMGYTFIDAGLKVLLGVVLLVAGVGLLKKRLWAQRMSMFWAVARMVVAIVMMVVTLGPAREFQAAASEMSDAGEQQFQAMVQGVGSILQIVFICAYPVVSLIFLSKKRVRDVLS